MIPLAEALRWRLAVARHETGKRTDRAMLWLAARLPHRFVIWVLAHVAVATLRGNEHPAEARYMDLWQRWEDRDLQGRAATRHRREK